MRNFKRSTSNAKWAKLACNWIYYFLCFDPKIPIDAFTNFLTLKNVPYCVTYHTADTRASFSYQFSISHSCTHELSVGECVWVRSVSVYTQWFVYVCVRVHMNEHFTSLLRLHAIRLIFSSILTTKIKPYRSCQIVRQSSQHNNAKSCQLSTHVTAKLTARKN